MFALIITVVLAILSNIISHYIVKWLDGKQKNDKA